jgi:glyoxylase-like metal-dependent hydrolase (beta-lactamase superfamily II)
MIFAEEFHSITPTLFHWSLFDPKVKCDLTSHAWQSEQGLVFFDPTPLAECALAELTEDRYPYAIFLTNSNHARSAEWYKKQFSIPVITSKSSIKELEITPDYTLDDFLTPKSIQSIPLDGGPTGETAYYIHEEKILILGDALIHLPQTGLAFLPDKYCIDPNQLRVSTQSLLLTSPRFICFAHGSPIVHQAESRLHSLLYTHYAGKNNRTKVPLFFSLLTSILP